MSQVPIADITPRQQFIATAGQTVFDTTFTANAASDILVYARAEGVDPDDATQLVSSSAYSVTFVGSSETVRVTFSSGRDINDVITIVRATPFTRTNLYSNTNYGPTMLNTDFGIHVMLEQQNKMYDQNISPKYNVSATIAAKDLVLPVLTASQIWAMNDTGDEIVAYDLGGGPAFPYLPLEGGTMEGDIDMNTNNIKDIGAILDRNNDELLGFQVDSAAVNYIDIGNAATGVAPTICAVGDDANVNLYICGQGDGYVNADNFVAGDPGTEGNGINFDGTTYNSVMKVSDIGGTNVAMHEIHRHSTTLAPLTVYARSNSDTSAHAAVTSGQSLMQIFAAGWDGEKYIFGGSLDFAVDGTPGIDDMPTRFRISVAQDGSKIPIERFRISNDGSIELRGTVTLGDSSAPSKAVSFDISGATTLTTTTLGFNQTADRTITFPNATDTLVGKATTDVFTNKSYDCAGTGNVLTNVGADEVEPGIIYGQTIEAAPDSSSLVMISDALGNNLYKTNAGLIAQLNGTTQIVQTTKTDVFSTSSTSFVDVTGMSVTITPFYSDSDILVMVTLCCSGGLSGTGGYPVFFQLVRGSTPLLIGDTAGSRTRITGGETSDSGVGSTNFNYVDSPATTSATTYKVQAMVPNASYTGKVNAGAADTDAAGFPRGASSIIAMEVRS